MEQLETRLEKLTKAAEGLKVRLDKFNPYHDAKGQFSSGGGGGGMAGKPVQLPAGTPRQMAMPTGTPEQLRAKLNEANKYHDEKVNSAKEHLDYVTASRGFGEAGATLIAEARTKYQDALVARNKEIIPLKNKLKSLKQ